MIRESRFRLRHAASLVAAAAALGLATVGIVRGTYAAGGSDSSCYALTADVFASGRLRLTSALAAEVPWPRAAETFAPAGFVPAPYDNTASVPVCAPGFSLLVAPLVAVSGRGAFFLATPLAGALLVWLTFLAARSLDSTYGSLSGAMAAVLVAASPPVLFQVVQPMNDIVTAALWMAVYVLLTSRRWAVSGMCCGLALLVRPNLLPMAGVALLYVVFERSSSRNSALEGLMRFALPALPFGLLVLFLNQVLYGSPLRTGYGNPEGLFAVRNAATNAPRYLWWLVETHSVFPFLAVAAPFLVSREKRGHVALGFALVLACASVYFFYTPFEDWSYLRFLLPAIALVLMLASVSCVAVVRRLVARRTAAVPIIAASSIVLAIFGVRAARERHAFDLQFLEQRYRSAGIVVRDHLPPQAVVLSVWDSGAIRFHGRKEAVLWQSLDAFWLDRSLVWLAQTGRRPYLLLESWEEPQFRGRFGGHSAIGDLDWPPKFEIDRLVRIYDPADRARYHRGEHVPTEFLWPLREPRSR